MGKANPDVSIPGAPAASSDSAAAASTDTAAAAAIDPKDVEIAQLRAQLQAATAPAVLVTEADGPNIRKANAESKHRHLTSAQLHEQVMSGKVKLTDHHVLCKDGWYVNPLAQKQANG